jgi:uncharacterized protein
MTETDLSLLLKTAHTIAVVGVSPDPMRPSHIVASYLQLHGYTIIPIHPSEDTILGQRVYRTISEIPSSITVDIVDVFRRPDAVVSVIDDLHRSGRRPVLWLQEGVASTDALVYAQHCGYTVVSDLCIKKVHMHVCS